VADVLLFVLGGLGCLVMMGFAMWLMGRIAARRGMSVKGLVRTVTRVRREGLGPTVKSSLRAVASWAEAERPDLRPGVAPDGTVTILFTDIENSTEINERLGDRRWLELLRAHRVLVRREVQEHGGYEVKSQGDGFMVAFPSARRALGCAVAIQRALAAEDPARLEETLRVRIGLHTGEAIAEGGDFYGTSVALAARIADRAEGGEILTSSLVRELAASGADVALEEAGEVELKGFRGRQRVYRVAWQAEGDRSRPSLRAVEGGAQGRG
jgi:class 3 adenylate cyclase